MAGIGSCHHVLAVKHLLGEFGNGDRPVFRRGVGGQRRETDEEEMQTREGNHVDCQFPQIRV